MQVLTGHENYVYAVAALPNGRLASGSDDETVRVWDVETGECVQVLTGHDDWVWDVETGECVQVLTRHDDTVHGVAALPDGRLASCSDADKTVQVWD